MPKKVMPPYIGAAYYPEMWPAEAVDGEIAKMKELGVNCVRVGEFAWSRMEPEEGKFDLAWLENVCDKMYAAGIAVIMCTPSATPPKWLTDKYPETLNVQSNGVPSQFGGRCHVCKSSPVMREKNRIIVRKMAELFGKHPAVIGWQLDNEIFHYGDGCFCPLCRERFTEYLKDKYKTVAALNAAWGTARWSQTYDGFDKVIPPRHDTWNHPSLVAEWMRFQDETIISYIREQAETVRGYSDAPIGTDMMPMLELSHEKMNAALDVVQINHYDRADELYRTLFLYDQMRPIKERPFWNTETQAGWNGSAFSASGSRPEGNCYVNTWLPVAKGGEMNLYWHWRAHPNGHEIGHGAVCSSSGRFYRVAEEIKRAAAEFRKCAAFLNGTRVESDIAIHCSATAAVDFHAAPILENFDYRDILLHNYYPPFRHHNVDLIDTGHDVDGYSVVISPFLANVEENGLKERMLRWVEEGGTWIVGPMSDIMTDYASRYANAPYSFLEEAVGVYTKFEQPIDDAQVFARWTEDGAPLAVSRCYDAYELRGAEALAEYAGGGLEGYACIARRSVGKGSIILLGSVIGGDDLLRLVAIPPIAEASENVALIERGGDAEGVIAAEIENKEGYAVFEGRYKNLVTGDTVEGKTVIPPYSVLVLQKIG